MYGSKHKRTQQTYMQQICLVLFALRWEKIWVVPFAKEGHYLAMCTSGVLKMKNRGYEDTSYESEQWQAHSSQNAGCE